MSKIEAGPTIATLHSIKTKVKAGKKYMWCSCGLSKKQPLCDGSHAGTGFKPVAYEATKDSIMGFCGCKHSSKGVICDGSHRNITSVQK